jgi:hypothetical protein
MGWDPAASLEGERSEERARTAWLMSPAVATALFFAAQLILAVIPDKPSASALNAAATEAPAATPVNVRVVTQIRNLDDGAHAPATARVPRSEGELLELLQKKGCVTFSTREVEKIGTLEAKFDAKEVGVITADKKLEKQRR